MLSHQIIRAVFWEMLPPKGFRVRKEWKPFREKAMREAAVPQLIERWMEVTGS